MLFCTHASPQVIYTIEQTTLSFSRDQICFKITPGFQNWYEGPIKFSRSLLGQNSFIVIVPLVSVDYQAEDLNFLKASKEESWITALNYGGKK